MIRAITNSDIPGLNRLSPPEWNMDYEAFLRSFGTEEFFHAFILLEDKKIVGTGNVLIKDQVGWLANIIVDKDYRGQGLGYQITRFLVNFLNKKKCKTQLLLATELGAAVYKKLGFIKTTYYRAFRNTADQPYDLPAFIRELEDSDLEKLLQFDQVVNDENRIHLIKRFYKTGLGCFDENNGLLGCFLPDFGRGLVLAKNSEVGIELLKLKHSIAGRSTLLPIENKVGIHFFENNEYTEGPRLARMVLGKENNWHPENIYSYGSGYCG